MVQIMFGTWPIVGKIVLRSIPSLPLVTIRVVGGAIALGILLHRTGRLKRLPGKDWLWLTIASLLGVVFNQLLYVSGLSLTTAINATLLSTTIPVFALVISIALGHDRASPARLSGILLAAAGVVYLVDPARADFSSHHTLGNLLIAASSLCYGSYIALSGNLFKQHGALNVTAWIFILGAILTLPIGVVSAGPLVAARGIAIWAALVYIILVPTIGAYCLNAWALTRVPPSTVATYIYFQPLIALGFAPVLLGEKWNSRSLIACALIFAGVAMVTRQNRARRAAEIAEDPDLLTP